MIDGSMPAQCSTFFGQPYTRPGMQPKQFFIESVAPAQWWVFIFGIEITTSASAIGCGIQISPRGV